MQPLTGTAIEKLRGERNVYDALKVLLVGENETREALEKGTYAPNPSYGRWGTVWTSVTAMRDGVPAPTWANIAVGRLPGFVGGDVMQGVVEVPEGYVEDGEWYGEAVFTFAAATTAGEVFTWALQMTEAGPQEQFFATLLITTSYATGAGDDSRQCVARFPAPAQKMNPLTLISFRIYRSGGATSVDPYLLGVRWVYQKQKFGLEEEP